jgi:hypothetical protein
MDKMQSENLRRKNVIQQVGSMWNGFIWLGIGANGVLCGHGNEFLFSSKAWIYLINEPLLSSQAVVCSPELYKTYLWFI